MDTFSNNTFDQGEQIIRIHRFGHSVQAGKKHEAATSSKSRWSKSMSSVIPF